MSNNIGLNERNASERKRKTQQEHIDTVQGLVPVQLAEGGLAWVRPHKLRSYLDSHPGSVEKPALKKF